MAPAGREELRQGDQRLARLDMRPDRRVEREHLAAVAAMDKAVAVAERRPALAVFLFGEIRVQPRHRRPKRRRNKHNLPPSWPRPAMGIELCFGGERQFYGLPFRLHQLPVAELTHLERKGNGS
jgi:hypothetical protein